MTTMLDRINEELATISIDTVGERAIIIADGATTVACWLDEWEAAKLAVAGHYATRKNVDWSGCYGDVCSEHSKGGDIWGIGGNACDVGDASEVEEYVREHASAWQISDLGLDA